MGQRQMINTKLRVSFFDLGVEGAVFRAGLLDTGQMVPLSAENWKFKGTDDERYHAYVAIAKAEIAWADAVGYEHVQFNRGKSLIEGFRGILIAQAHEAGKLCVGVNVATLKAFAIKKRWSDKSRKEKNLEPLDQKQKMAKALKKDHPDFMDFLLAKRTYKDRLARPTKLDDLVDAAWGSIWLLEKADLL